MNIRHGKVIDLLPLLIRTITFCDSGITSPASYMHGCRYWGYSKISEKGIWLPSSYLIGLLDIPRSIAKEAVPMPNLCLLSRVESSPHDGIERERRSANKLLESLTPLQVATNLVANRSENKIWWINFLIRQPEYCFTDNYTVLSLKPAPLSLWQYTHCFKHLCILLTNWTIAQLSLILITQFMQALEVIWLKQ